MTRIAAYVFTGLATTAVACGTTRLDAGSSDGSDAAVVEVTCGAGRRATRTICRVICRQAEGALCGTVVVGEGDPLPLPTDATSPPPGAPSPLAAHDALPREGFEYQFYVPSTPRILLDGGAVTEVPHMVDQRVRFSINPLQVYKAWCNMQPSYLWTPGSYDPRTPFGASPPRYGCVAPNAITSGAPGQTCDELRGLSVRYASCAQAEYCTLGNVCLCFGKLVGDGLGVFGGVDTGCTAAYTATVFDVTVTDDVMAGSVVFPGSVEAVRLSRTP